MRAPWPVSRRRDERGAVAVMAALLSAGLFLTAALVIDLGLARDTRRDSQNASDASALAAANALYPDSGSCSSPLDPVPPCFNDAIAEAKEYAAVNFDVVDADWDGCTDSDGFWVVTGTTACISFTDGTEAATEPEIPTKVRVVMPLRDVDVRFGASADVERISIGSAARASLADGSIISCGLCILGTGLHHIGNGDTSVLSLTGGAGIHINGSLAGQANSEVTAQGGAITIEGSFGASDFDPPPTNGPRIGDPMADLVFPDYAAVNPKNSTNPCADGPGVYEDYEVGNNQTCTLSAGTYVFTGTLSLKNTSTLLGTGVSLFFTCGDQSAPRSCASIGEPGGIFDAKNGEVRITHGAGATPTLVDRLRPHQHLVDDPSGQRELGAHRRRLRQERDALRERQLLPHG